MNKHIKSKHSPSPPPPPPPTTTPRPTPPPPTPPTPLEKPIIQWVGGKQALVKPIVETSFPNEIYGDYHEPFVGGGGMLLGVLSHNDIKIHGNVYAYESNECLINMYKNVQQHPRELCEKLVKLSQEYNKSDNTIKMVRHDGMTAQKAYYYWIRKQFNEMKDKSTLQASTYFMFITKTCFRSVLCFNKRNPNTLSCGFGNAKKVSFDEKHIHRVSSLIQKVRFIHNDFEESLSQVKNSNDFVYMDPPYYQTYSAYTSDGFNMKHHTTLFDITKNLLCPFVMSNSDEKFVKECFQNYTITAIDVKKTVNGVKRHELLIY